MFPNLLTSDLVWAPFRDQSFAACVVLCPFTTLLEGVWTPDCGRQSSQAWWGMNELWAKWRSPSLQMVIIKGLHLDCSQKKCFFSLTRICNSYVNLYIYFGCFWNIIFFFFFWQILQVSPAFQTCMWWHFTFTKDLRENLFSLTGRKLKRILLLQKKKRIEREKVTIGSTLA